MSAAAMAKDMGAERVIVLDRIPHRLELAKRFGADVTVNIDEFEAPQDRIQHVRDLTEFFALCLMQLTELVLNVKIWNFCHQHLLLQMNFKGRTLVKCYKTSKH